MKNILPLSDSSFSELEKLFKEISFEKDEVFVKVGQRNNSEYIIVEGYCRSFLLNPEGEEITLSFYKTNSVLSPHIIRTKNNQSLFNLQALTKLHLIEFDSDQFLNLMIQNLEIRNFGNSILLNELIKKTEKEISLGSLSAKDRLINFRNEYSLLENLIPHSIIASYLGITNVSLSRLRKEILKG
ncbi:MAG: Crp/Fnr family transcriptional regulator [Bacteroidetes bacterium]|nr:Crp/Fnr family transcriptional regulator [Bacteroidota bacterium]MBL0033075.1 Crp/Fnr family transcriptional regulator [Bacteroidota bacterium]MBP6656444.1 Crp/Fnr family transcriptional regulator [Bacteroidia bacterium]